MVAFISWLYGEDIFDEKGCAEMSGRSPLCVFYFVEASIGLILKDALSSWKAHYDGLVDSVNKVNQKTNNEANENTALPHAAESQQQDAVLVPHGPRIYGKNRSSKKTRRGQLKSSAFLSRIRATSAFRETAMMWYDVPYSTLSLSLGGTCDCMPNLKT